MRFARLLLPALVALSGAASAQEAPRMHRNIFYSNVPNTTTYAEVSFTLSAKTVVAIRASAPFLAFGQDETAIGTWVDRGVTDTLAMYLEQHVGAAVAGTQAKLPGGVSFQFVPNGRQSISVDRAGNLVVSFTFLSQYAGAPGSFRYLQSSTDSRGTSIR
ncbi:hypothetical protein [Flaviaesturariibacter amylovorans]|uniref:Uncharacterized protein n=1 Tax=Flaviaesturariibacter amylovorans TaxID=1084520 RepID=A0ABP8HET5_9BACT